MSDPAKQKISGRDTQVLSLLVLRSSKEFLIAMKEQLDIPQGRLLDRAVRKLALETLGEDVVKNIENQVAKNKMKTTPRSEKS